MVARDVDLAGAGLPDPPPRPAPLPDLPLGDDAVDVLQASRDELVRAWAVRVVDAEANANRSHFIEYNRSSHAAFVAIDRDKLRALVDALNGDKAAAPLLASPTLLDVLQYQHRIESRADFGLYQALRMDRHHGWDARHPWQGRRFQVWLQRQDLARIDLRQLGDAAAHVGLEPEAFARACTVIVWDPSLLPQGTLAPGAVWLALVEHHRVVDLALEMEGMMRPDNISLSHTLAALDTFPAIPQRWLARLIEIALVDSKANRPEAQRLLAARVPDIGERLLPALRAATIDMRIEAARWLARLDYRPAVPALYAALDKESRETARAAQLAALERLGEDLAPRLAPDVLLKEARKGLKARLPAGMEWLTADLLPAFSWLDGARVEPEIVQWWIVLSAKLKEAAPNALLVRYAALLAPASRAALGRFVLQQFIARDTVPPTPEEAAAWARDKVAYMHQHFGTSLGQFGDVEWWTRQRLTQCAGSAIGIKGMLALAFAMPGQELADTVRAYMRDHYLRRAQIEAMLEAASGSDDPAAIGLVLATARRYRTATVKEKARRLVDAIAERNGWTPDELADRTVPTGGLDETGRMTFQYGGREFTVVLDEKLKPVLHNAEGKAIAALPEPRKDDDPDSIKEGKGLLAACRKEVKEVVAQQTARLYEAMCAGRVWAAGEWDEHLRRHPVVGRLAQRLAWIRLDADGAVLGVFRPTEDGSLLDAHDEEVTLEPDARVGLAHASLLDDAAIAAWLAHFKDYKVTPLFRQFQHRFPASVDPEAFAIDDRQGWMSETYALRNVFRKLGYERAAPVDSGIFVEYVKELPAAGFRVRIAFTGNQLPEENRPAALKELSFARLGPRHGHAQDAAMRLGDVPVALLAEACGDYHAVAASCMGFDPEWEKKAEW